jgi:hypothetical protein
MADFDERKAINEERAANPQVGDVWEDHMVMCALVLEVTESTVTVCREKTQHRDGWSWDFAKAEVMPRDDFRKWLHYGCIPGTWAWVMTGNKNAHAHAALWREHWATPDHAFEFEIGG